MKDCELSRLMKMMEIENSLYDRGYEKIAGIDEAGRGPLCGSVVAACVILKKDTVIEGINDSKKLSEKKRELLYDEIMNKALAVGIGQADMSVIEDVNILNATKTAMLDALNNICIKPDYVLIDGNQKIDIDISNETVISGDALSISIAAASIIAKVTRDKMLYQADKLYPEYNFAKNKGYGTKAHIQAIAEYGLTPIHRESFCKHFEKAKINKYMK